MPASRADERRPRKALVGTVYTCGCTVFMMCLLATGFGVTAILLGSQANVCITPYSYSRHRTSPLMTEGFEKMKYTDDKRDTLSHTTIGWYSAPTALSGSDVTWIEEDPMNCITECQMNCTAAYSEQQFLLKDGEVGGCSDCLRHCTHPWGKNIETCHTSPECTENRPKHHGIVNFCQPIAMCFQMCAGRGYGEIDKRAGQDLVAAGPVQWNKDPKNPPSKQPTPAWTTAGYENNQDVEWWGPTKKNKKLRCIRECEYDGKLTVGFGIAAMALVLLGPFVMLVGAMSQLKQVAFLFIALLLWTASLILAVDAFLLNMQRNKGRGWEMMYYENLPVTFSILAKSSGEKHKVTFNWMMHVIFGLGLLSNLFALLAWYDPEEIWNRRKAVEPRAQNIPEPQEKPKAKPQPMQYYAEDRAREDEVMSGGTAVPIQPNEFNVDIGIRWERAPAPSGNDVTEIVVKEIVPGGAADEACTSGMNGKNTPAPGDVVLLVGNVIAGEKEPKMHHVYGEPYSKWIHLVRGQPAGTKIRFMFARHSEVMKYQFDVVRQNAGEGVGGTRFGNASTSAYRFHIEEEAGADLRETQAPYYVEA